MNITFHARRTIRRGLQTLAATALSVAAALGQTSVIRDYSVAMPNSYVELGATVAGVGDVDGDGFDDIAYGDPGFSNGYGRVIVRSGATGATLLILPGVSDSRFGAAIAPVGDADGDGNADLAVSAPLADLNGADTGRVVVYSGATGAVLGTIDGGQTGADFGFALAGLGDNDGNDLVELAIGAPLHDNGGDVDEGSVIIVELGPIVSISDTFEGIGAGDEFGYALAPAGDFTGSGTRCLAVGAPDADLGGDDDRGSVDVYALTYSPTSHTLVARRFGGEDDEHLGRSVAGCVDIDGDGLDDVVAGAPGYGLFSYGRVSVLCGPLGATLYSDTGSFQAHLGTSVCGIGDLDGDGFDDYAAGAPQPSAVLGAAGYVRAYSGRDGTLIEQIDSPVGSAAFGCALAAAGDHDDDGLADFIAGGPNGHVVQVLGMAAATPGSEEDFVLATGVDDIPSRRPTVKTAGGGSTLNVELRSPEGSYAGTLPYLAGTIFPTGGTTPSVPAFPELHLDESTAFLLFNPLGGALATYLAPDGLSLGFVLPPALSGASLMLQGIAPTASAKQMNPFFTATDGHEIQIMLLP